MTKIYLTPNDLTQLRFGYSPLVQAVKSFCLLQYAVDPTPYRQWVEEARQALYDVNFTYLVPLMAAPHYIPDFLTPTPLTVQMHFEDEIAGLLATPDDIVRKNVQRVIAEAGESEMLHNYLTYPREMLICLAEELRLYWQRALAHHWARLTAILEGDILYHARLLAVEGPEKLLDELHPKIHYQDLTVIIDKQHCSSDDYHLNGSGLQLVPVVFAKHGPSYQIEPEWHPMILYGVRGAGLWDQQSQTQRTSRSLELALGSGRARVLQTLTTPLNTGEIARTLEISSGAVSQHLNRLQQAGLVEPRRSSKWVYYHLTPRGEELLQLFDRTS
jgi:DNA-binding transcriptional ArsR family regulator